MSSEFGKGFGKGFMSSESGKGSMSSESSKGSGKGSMSFGPLVLVKGPQKPSFL